MVLNPLIVQPMVRKFPCTAVNAPRVPSVRLVAESSLLECAGIACRIPACKPQRLAVG